MPTAKVSFIGPATDEGDQTALWREDIFFLKQHQDIGWHTWKQKGEKKNRKDGIVPRD